MLRLQAVNRHNEMKIRQGGPALGNGTNRTGHQLHFNLHIRELGQQNVQLTIANQRFASNDGEVQRAETMNQGKDAIDQIFTSEVSQLAETSSAPQMFGFVSVATGASQRALLGDFNREHRAIAF